jgi:DNA sulfur modification protein DndD
MLLTKVILNDLGVYRGRNEFDFKTTQDKPIILIGGTNGAGKTTLFESVVLCLYGRDSFEEKLNEQKYQEVIGRQIHRYLGTKKSAEEASVIMEFQFAHEGKVEEFQIIRMWQNNNGRIDETFTIKKKNPSDEEFVEVSEFEKEEDKQIFINQLIPRGIVKLFFFDGEKIQNIAEHGNEGRHISSSFDTLLGLDLIKLLGDDIGRALLRESSKSKSKLESQVEDHVKEKKECEVNIENNSKKITERNAIIKTLEIKSQKLEDEFNQIGGNFAKKREQYTIDKVKHEAKLDEIEKEIRALCSDTLPFSLIPDQLEEVKKEIQEDEKRIEANLEKSILENRFSEIISEIKRESFLKDVTSDVKNKVTDEFDSLLQNKLETAAKHSDLVYNLSTIDMKKIVQLIDKVKDKDATAIEAKVKSFVILQNEVERLNVGLESAPKEAESGPLFSKLRESERELAEKRTAVEILEQKITQDRSLIVLLNQKIRKALHGEIDERKSSAMQKMGNEVQEVLDIYAENLRSSKIKVLENEIFECLDTLLHKENFVEKVSIDKETFEVKLFKGDDDEITKDMLSKGELQMYATAIVWGLAKTSGRPLPFIIDTPLARLDEEHRTSLVEEFYPERHQTIILSTDSEINYEYYKKLKPNISNEFVIQYDSSEGKTDIQNRYFYDSKGEKIIEV